MAVSKALRFQVLRRDNHACRYCGRVPPEVKLTVDHVVPTALGGSDAPDNLVTACSECNGGKSATPADAALVADVAEDAVRWGRALEAAAARLLSDLNGRRAARDEFLEHWNTWTVGAGEGAARTHVPLPDDWPTSVDNLRATGLPADVLYESLDIAMRNQTVNPENTFRYMCGVVWNRVREMQDMARAEVGDAAGEEGVTFEEWAAIPRGELEGHLWRFDTITEGFLQRIPMFVHEAAEAATDREYELHWEGDPASRLQKLPDVLRHVGSILSRCNVQMQPEQDNEDPWAN